MSKTTDHVDPVTAAACWTKDWILLAMAFAERMRERSTDQSISPIRAALSSQEITS